MYQRRILIEKSAIGAERLFLDNLYETKVLLKDLFTENVEEQFLKIFYRNKNK